MFGSVEKLGFYYYLIFAVYRCIAYATSTEIKVDTAEIEEARWFSLDEVDLICKNQHPDKITIPTDRTIANQLINYWNNNKAKL